MLIICGLVFAIGSYGLLSISATTVMVYFCTFHVVFACNRFCLPAAGGLQFFSSMMSPGFRAFIPKMVNKNETGELIVWSLVVKSHHFSAHLHRFRHCGNDRANSQLASIQFRLQDNVAHLGGLRLRVMCCYSSDCAGHDDVRS